jgi:hypothetical protein
MFVLGTGEKISLHETTRIFLVESELSHKVTPICNSHVETRNANLPNFNRGFLRKIQF